MERISELIDEFGWSTWRPDSPQKQTQLFNWMNETTSCILQLQEENKRLKESLSSIDSYLLELGSRNI